MESIESRCSKLLRSVVRICKYYQTNLLAKRIIPQLIASSGSIGANYLEATAALSKKDFVKCLKIARKEARECLVWIEGLREVNSDKDGEFDQIVQETKELSYILTSIISKNDG